MKKKLFMLFAILALVMLAACGKDNTNNKDKNASDNNEEEELKVLEVKLDAPEKADVNEKINLKATVTHGDDKVKDADEVDYEIWENGKKDDSKMEKSKNNKDGTYTLETNFEHDGEFIVQVHVTAREQHTMPKATITVGKGASEKEASNDEHAEHGTEGFSIHFMKPEDVKAKDKKDLIVHLELNEKPFENGKVRYEIVRENEKKVEWVDAEEKKAGEYHGNFEFVEKGTYKVVVHVKDDKDLHEHEEHEIIVK